ncbi:hypothetical protein FAZ69_08495 [Trinickia terrae]|uniref:Uncharacterized protein n=1 Tax=Trinickia terrae TaxID=2571161 RepID=A0A4U1I9L1_9BURK|nr:hypothetical protein [Trinickia terrae]TKC90176.1 hypothetical protein FAZ69_08495 [Trinickia terrae]
MADRMKGGRAPADKAPIFIRLRKAIGEALQQPGLTVRKVSHLELAIGALAPSTILKGCVISDYPFPMCRYVSARDGHVYHVKGPTEDGEQIVAYRQGFLTSLFTSRGGIAVAISEEGWMGSVMILYSLMHAHFEMDKGALQDVHDEWTTRRSYPIKRFRVYLAFMRRRIATWPVVQNLVALTHRA